MLINRKKKHLCCSSVRLRHIIYLDEFCTSGGRLKESTRLNTKSFTFSSILYDVNFRYQFPHTLTVTKRCDYVFPSRLNISGRRLHALVNKKWIITLIFVSLRSVLSGAHVSHPEKLFPQFLCWQNVIQLINK